MAAPEKQGKTLWEMCKERFGSNGSHLTFYNPLDLRVGSMVPVTDSRTEFEGFDFSVTEIREYTRRMGGQDFRFTDYVLIGINPKTIGGVDKITLRLRAAPNEAGTHDTLLLRLSDELAFDQGFLDVVNDTTGIFEVGEDDGQKETYQRLNDVKGSYQAVVLVIKGTTDDGKANRNQTSAGKLEYWDYWREVTLPGGQATKTEFLFVEMNADTGWFQIWIGGEYFP